MKWLNMITQTTDGNKEFAEITYELFSSPEDLEKGSAFTEKARRIMTEKTETVNTGLAKLAKLVKKLKKPESEVYIVTPAEDYPGYVFKAMDPKAQGIVDELNANIIYVDKLNIYLNTPYIFTEKDIELMPELGEVPELENRYVYSIPFNALTSWNKLGVSEPLRRSFTVAMAMTRIAEQIV